MRDVGSIDMPLEGFEVLASLIMRNASLHGQLPESWPMRLTNMGLLDLASNPGISGTIPTGEALPNSHSHSIFKPAKHASADHLHC